MAKDVDSFQPSKISDLVRRKRTLTEKILSVFPGYKGYKEKELMRETAELVRDVTFRSLKDVSERVRRLYRQGVAGFGLSEEVRMLEKLSMRTDALAERVRHATYGYTPFMYVLQVDEEALLRLMEFDASLADYIKGLEESVKNVEEELSPGKLSKESIKKVENAISMLEDTLDKRREALLGLSGE